MDDGSTDRTSEIVIKLCEKHSIIKLISIANQGVSHARNIGVEESTGAYITFLDDDSSLSLMGSKQYRLYIAIIKDMESLQAKKR